MEDITPNVFPLTLLQTFAPEDVDSVIRGVKNLQSTYPNGAGFIIAGYYIDNEDVNCQLYLDEYESISAFGDEGHSERPKVYKSAKNAYKALIRHEDILTPEYKKQKLTYDVALWMHPDLGIPNSKYLKMTGSQFPGSPRR